jgi:protein-tyrosine phosphatase
VPHDAELGAFADLVTGVVDAVRGGKTVVVHCRGGLGRSGLVAASCLVVLGLRPAAAIARVRQGRAGAVETPAQEDWVRRFAGAAGERRAR